MATSLRHDIPLKKTMLYTLLYTIAWFLYGQYIMPFSSISTDPCSATPGQDNTLAFIIVPVYIILFGFIFYRLSRSYLPSVLNIPATIFAVIVLPLTLMISVTLFFDKDDFQAWIREHDLFTAFYVYGCYHEIELKASMLLLLTTLLLYICLCIYFISLHQYKLRHLRKAQQ